MDERLYNYGSFFSFGQYVVSSDHQDHNWGIFFKVELDFGFHHCRTYHSIIHI